MKQIMAVLCAVSMVGSIPVAYASDGADVAVYTLNTDGNLHPSESTRLVVAFLNANQGPGYGVSPRHDGRSGDDSNNDDHNGQVENQGRSSNVFIKKPARLKRRRIFSCCSGAEADACQPDIAGPYDTHGNLLEQSHVSCTIL
jgi:hypothetical protein